MIPIALLIDSEQLESVDALDDNFRAMASDEIDPGLDPNLTKW